MKKRNFFRILECDHKKIFWFLLLLFIISLIPILYLSGFDHATGDDYGYGFRAHCVWLETHDLREVIRMALETARIYWHSWQGTWFTIFLMALQPEVFSPNAYWVVPWLMLAVNIGSTSLLLHYFMVRRLGLPVSTFLCVDILLLMSMVQFFPSTKSGIFWYNGSVHYIVPYGLAMLAVYCFFQYADNGKIRYLVISAICMACLGGASYLAALLAPIVLVYVIVGYARKNKRVWLLLIPLAFEMPGLYISVTAPGNKVRGGEDFGLDLHRASMTVLRCFEEAVRCAAGYWKEKPAAFLAMLAAAFLIYEGFREQKKPVLTFRFPLLFVLLMYMTWCAAFAPGLYADVSVSGGVPNTIWQVFLLTVLASIIYIAGWLAKKRCDKPYDRGRARFWMAPALAIALCWLFVHKGTLKDTTFYVSYVYISSGQAEDFREQIASQMEILLDDSIREAYLVPINDDQGPLMHMPVTTDENAFTNWAVKCFYQKDKVVMITE